MSDKNSRIFDYIVVGAGTAGCAVASRLAEDPGNRVLLLEAGGGDNHFHVRMPVAFTKAVVDPALNWGYESEPEPFMEGRTLPIPRGKLLGGSSSINGMFHIRGNPRDFDEWRDLGNEGWGYADVLPYFRRSEESWLGEGTYHGGGGPVQTQAIDTRKLLHEPLKQAAMNAGYKFNQDYDGASQEGFANGQVAIDRDGRRHSTARAYLSAKRRVANLQIETKATVQRLVFQGQRVVGIEYLRNDKLVRAEARREVVLSAGAYNTPKLLMLSGIGPAAELAAHGIPVLADLPGVGQNLIEHPCVSMRFLASTPVTFTNELRFDRATLSVLRWALLGNGPFATQICNGTLLLRTRPELDRPDVQLLCNPVAHGARLWFPGVVTPTPQTFFITVCLLHERSRGHVSLRSANPADRPRIFLNLLSDPEDVKTLREAVKITRQLYHTEPMASLIGEETVPGEKFVTDAQLDAEIPKIAGITHHPVGTCRMGNDALAVVDANLRVRGIEGLRIADASIMPTIPSANTNAASIMIGEKAADLILGRSLPPARIAVSG